MFRNKKTLLALSLPLTAALMTGTPSFGSETAPFSGPVTEAGESGAMLPVVTQEVRRLWAARQALKMEMEEQQGRMNALSAKIDDVVRQQQSALERIRTTLEDGTAERASLKKEIAGLQALLKTLSGNVERLQSGLDEGVAERDALKKDLARLRAVTEERSAGLEEKIAASADRQQAVLDETRRTLEARAAGQTQRLEEDRESIGSLRTYAILLSVLGLLGLLCGLWALVKARKLAALQTAGRSDLSGLAEKLGTTEDTLSGLMGENVRQLDELAAIAKALAGRTEGSSEPPHALIRALADRITFMQMTLSRMDGSVRGHRQLVKSIKQIRDNLQAYGYEIVDMLGQPYNDGIKAVASFIDDDGIPKGQRIITGVTKPQINYNGTMIQSAQITVSQNI